MIENNIKEKLKNYFLENPTEKLRVRQIEKKAKISLPSAINYSKELEKKSILKSTIISKVKFYSADRTSKKFRLEKKLHNIRMLYESGLVKTLVEETSNATIVVFGSYANGDDIETSDIDIYLQTPSKKEIDVKKFEKKLKHKFQFFNYAALETVENKELVNSIINGIVLNGFLEVF